MFRLAVLKKQEDIIGFYAFMIVLLFKRDLNRIIH